MPAASAEIEGLAALPPDRLTGLPKLLPSITGLSQILLNARPLISWRQLPEKRGGFLIS
jgi:hypothetical protein